MLKQITKHTHNIRTCRVCGGEFFVVFSRIFTQKVSENQVYGSLVEGSAIARISGYKCATCGAMYIKEGEHHLKYMNYDRQVFWEPFSREEKDE